MARNQIVFFAAGSDLTIVFSSICEKHRLSLVQAGSFNGEPHVYTSIADVPDIGKSVVEDQSKDRFFLFIFTNTPVRPRLIRQNNGIERFVYDQMENPNSVILKPGGVIKSAVISGQLGTASVSPVAIDLFKILTKSVKTSFKKIGSYYVGPEAKKLMDEGYRLTANLNAPTKYDLDPGI